MRTLKKTQLHKQWLNSRLKPVVEKTVEEATAETNEETSEEKALQSNCLYETCVRDAIIVKSEENLLVFFDLSDRNGDVILGEEKFMMGDLLVAGYLISENGSEETVFQTKLTNQQYNCYSGEDLPWNQGVPTATCGFSVPLAELKVAPQLGDRVRIELPSYDNFTREVVIQDRAVLE